MSQAFIGNSYVQNIINGEVAAFVQGHRAIAALPADSKCAYSSIRI